jgi:ferredoxin-NADP reductase
VTRGANSVTAVTETPPAPRPWQAAELVGVRRETARMKTFRFLLPEPAPFWPGQHFVLRLTAPDGYTAQRAYSAASPPGDLPQVAFAVDRLADGEVSGFLHDVAAIGDRIAVRGPIGGHFVWRGDRPATLIGGGSGLAPLVCMLRHARRIGRADLLRLVAVVRSPDQLPFADALWQRPDVTVLFSRVAPPGWHRPPGRLSRRDLEGPLVSDGDVYLCGSSGFVDAAAAAVLAAGARADRIRVERFGPTGT